jgi:hypothetical protein
MNFGCESHPVAGIDDWNNNYDMLADYVNTIHSAVDKHVTLGSSPNSRMHFVVHSRHAVLTRKLSPDQNRKIPPLMYDYAYRLVKDFPGLYVGDLAFSYCTESCCDNIPFCGADIDFSINGGIQTYDECLEHLKHGIVGCMVGRAFVDRPLYWSNLDSLLYGEDDIGNTNSALTQLMSL